MNRTQEPFLQLPEKISIPQPEKILLANGIQLYCINAGEQELLKLEIVFKAGEWYSDFPVLMTAVNDYLTKAQKVKQHLKLQRHLIFTEPICKRNVHMTMQA